MPEKLSAAEARQALAAVERSRHEVLKEVGMPRWYWWSLAIGWIVVGLAADLGNAWGTGAATFLFGMLHAMLYGRVVGGRHRTDRVSVRADTVGRHVSLVVLASLVGMAAVTIVAGFLASADGARHPSTMASVLVAVMILLGGPTLMGAIRRSAGGTS
jgi:hypothetical protein